MERSRLRGRTCRRAAAQGQLPAGPPGEVPGGRRAEHPPLRRAVTPSGGLRVVPVANQLKVGNVILHNGKPYRVAKVLHVTPGNWRGMVQTRFVDLVTGNGTEHRFRSEDKVDLADMETHVLKFLYQAGDHFHFMNTENYEMIEMSADDVGDAK